MQSRLLIINCPSEYFVHVPIGTFGLCDYLSQRNIPVRILNLSLYESNEMGIILEHYLNLFQPTHIGLIFHWQESAEGVLWVSEYIESRFKHLKIICGGFTAGYFGENLLERCRSIDYVIKGDPEKPLELLLGGAELSRIPNLVYRDTTGIFSNGVSYCIDREILSRISFSELTYLYDHELYLKAIEGKLGFSLFIGRGCEFSCHYFGGSRGSFRLHSGRVEPVVRSIESVIADLKRLKDFTRTIYICYENDQEYIKALFKAMIKEGTLVKTFQLNYGAWQLLDEEFLELYRYLFTFKDPKPTFEFSPEVFDDQSRKKIKHPKVTYSMRDLKANLSLIKSSLGDKVNVSLFFSRYHDTHKTYLDIKKEIINIFRLKHDFLCNTITNVKIHYDHLSTDVASHYWESYVENPRNFDTLMAAIRKLKTQEQYSFPINNLCIYIPETLSEEEIFRYELLILMLTILENYFHEMFHIIFKCLDEVAIELIEEIITEEYLNKPGNMFETLNYCELLDYIKQKVTQKESLLGRLPFIEDMTSLFMKKAMCWQRPLPYRSLYQTEKPRLNYAFISMNDYDYLDLQNFMKKLEKEDPGNLSPEKTVFIFLVDEILSMSYITFRATLNEFQKGVFLDQYYILMNRRGISNLSYHKDLVARLFKSGVLY